VVVEEKKPLEVKVPEALNPIIKKKKKKIKTK